MATGATTELEATFADDVRLLDFTPHADARGRLVEFDFSEVPFTVRRVFAISGVPAGATRGGHRHLEVDQLLCCLSGRVEVEVRRGDAQHEVALTPETGALYIASGVWAEQRYAEDASVLVVLASQPFDPASYDTGF